MLHFSVNHTFLDKLNSTPPPCSSAESVFPQTVTVFSQHGVERGMGGVGRVEEGLGKDWEKKGVCSQTLSIPVYVSKGLPGGV